ncbi:MAG: glycosyl hydrolase family 18 [Lachnospiraceae bacterium]|nr:glycosyl hydrolase family 18 [Lachnospiraceae bacterium]
MQDDNNRKNTDALLMADDVIANALRQKELEEAIAETDRAVAELAAQRKKEGRAFVPPAPEIDDEDLEEAAETEDPKAEAPEDVKPKAEDPETADPEAAAPKTAAPKDTDPMAEVKNAADSKKDSKKDPKNKRKDKTGRAPGSAGKKILLFLVIAALAVSSVYLIRRYTPTSRRMSYREYFGEMAENEAAIVLQDENLQERALVAQNGSLYIPYELVRSSLNERFYWDETLNNVIFTTPLQTYEIPINSTSYTVIDGALTSDPTSEATYKEIILLRDESSSALYLSMDFIAEYTNVTYSFEKETQHVYLRNKWGDTLVAAAAKDSAVRYQGGIKSPILTDLNKGDKVMVLEELPHWMKVLTIDGFIGYVKSNRMSEPNEVSILNEGFTPQDYTSQAPDEKVTVVWHMLSGKSANKNFEDDTAAMTGVTAISPTWFSLADNDGSVDSTASAEYVKQAHAKGLQVWGLVSDFSADMDTSAMLASTASRRRCIGQLIGYAADLDLDGINIDFEYMEEPDALCYTQFIREMSIACRRAELILSVDLVPPFDFNAYLNRVEIAQVADYLITMGYDEHYAGSESAGSVASLPYEENAINTLLGMGIPSKKLISAIPFYTRIWYTSTDADGITYVNSEELSMNSVAATIDSWHLKPVWDAESSQNYVGWHADDGVLCEIWIEDEQSLQRKALLTSKYDLGGTAIWALGFERNSVWDVISKSSDMSPEEAALLETQLIEEAAAAASQTEAEGQEASQTEADL